MLTTFDDSLEDVLAYTVYDTEYRNLLPSKGCQVIPFARYVYLYAQCCYVADYEQYKEVYTLEIPPPGENKLNKFSCPRCFTEFYRWPVVIRG